MKRRDLWPIETRSEDDARRLRHEDLPDIEREMLWAEEMLLRQAVARIIYHGERPVLLGVREGRPLDAGEWGSERIRRLAGEIRRRDTPAKAAS